MRKIPSIADYFVIAGGTSTTQVRAIADSIVKEMKEVKEKLWHSEGEREGLWILLDYGAVVAHIFYEETRRYYDLEQLWGDAPQAHFKEAAEKRTIGHAKKKKRTPKPSSR
jgi:ribosome-associated protein